MNAKHTPGIVSVWWLSFADDDGFRGVSCVEAPSFLDAVREARARGCNPGGEVQGVGPVELPEAVRPHLNRLLSRAEAEALDDVIDGMLSAEEAA